MSIFANFIALINIMMSVSTKVALRKDRFKSFGILALCGIAYIGNSANLYACASCGDKIDIPVSFWTSEQGGLAQVFSTAKLAIGTTSRSSQGAFETGLGFVARGRFKASVKLDDFTVKEEVHYQSFGPEDGGGDIYVINFIKVRVPCGAKGVAVDGRYIKINPDHEKVWYSDSLSLPHPSGYDSYAYVGRSEYENETIPFDGWVQNPKAEKQTWLSIGWEGWWSEQDLSPGPIISRSFNIKFDFGQNGKPSLGSFKSGFQLGVLGIVNWYAVHIEDCLGLDSVTFASEDAANGELIDSISKKQLRIASGGLAEAESASGQLSIRVFEESQVGVKDGSGFYTHSGNPAQRAEITDAGSGLINYKLYDGASLVGDWTLQENDNPRTFSMLDNLTGRKDAKINDVDGNGDVIVSTESWQIESGEPDQLISKVTNTYHTFEIDHDSEPSTPPDIFEKLIRSVDDPDGAAIATVYTYGVTPGEASYGEQITTSHSDGSWTWNQYDNLPSDVSAITWSGFGNTSMPGSIPTSDAGYAKEVEYDDGTSETYQNGHLTRKTRETISTGTFAGEQNLRVSLLEQWYGTGATEKLSTITYEYPETQRTLAVVNPDGTCTKYAYEKGTFNPNDGSFTADSNGEYLLTTAYRGKVNSGGTDIELISFKSTATESIEDAEGTVIQGREQVYNGSGFDVMTTTRHIYADDNLVESVRDGETVYSADYDSSGNLESSTDEFGVVTTVSEFGNMTTYTADDGEVESVSTTATDVAGRILSQTDGGLTTVYSYEQLSGGGTRQTATLPSTATSVTETYADGQLKAIHGTAEVSRSYTYTPQAGGIVTAETVSGDGVDRTTTTTRDMLGRTVSVTSPKFGGGTATSVYQYDPQTGQLLSIARGGGAIMAPQMFTYDELGRPELSGYDMDGGGLSTGSTSDRITRTEQAYASANGKWYSVTTSGVYLPSGLVTTQEVWNRVDGRETIVNGPGDRTVTTTVTVDRPNQTVTVEELDSQIGTPSEAVYAGYRSLKESQEPFQYGTSARTTYAYANGRLQSISDAANQTTSFTYHGQGEPGAGREHVRTLPDNATMVFDYNSRDQVDVVSGTGIYWSKNAYNAFGELTGLATKRAGSEDWTIWSRDPGTGLVSEKADAANNTVHYGYNAAGWLTSRTWARNVTTTYGYTKAGEVDSIDYSDGTPDVTGMAYDRGGRLTNVTDAAGIRTITYSDFGQRASETWSGSGLLSGYSVSRAYTANRRTSLSASGPGGFSYPGATYSYDPANKRLTGISQGDLTVTYTPQPGMSQPQTVTSAWNGGATLTRSIGHDMLGRTTHVTNSVGGNAISAHGSVVDPIQYDARNRRTEIKREDGPMWVYGYNSRGEVETGKKRFADGTFVPGHQFTYQFDGIGNRTEASMGGNPAGADLAEVSYTPTELNQYSAYTTPSDLWITGESRTDSQAFVNGKWAWRHGTFFAKSVDLGNQSGPNWKALTVESKLLPTQGNPNMLVASESGQLLVPPANIVPAFDDDGNLTADGLWSYAWDGENRLKSMETVSSLPESAQRRFEFDYDFEGRRVRAARYTKSGINWVAAGETAFLHDGWNLLAERHPQDDHAYLWGLDLIGTLNQAGGVGGLLAFIDVTTGQTCSVAYDANGNVTAMVNALTGGVDAVYEYGPFGEPLRVSGPMADANPFRWSSKYTDSESGLVYYGYRYYSPVLGRWLSRDPIGEDGGVNLYEFVYNNPISAFDRLGLFVIYIHTQGVGHMGATVLSTSWDVGRYMGKYKDEWFDWSPGPNMIKKTGGKSESASKSGYEEFSIDVSAPIDKAIQSAFSETFNSGKTDFPKNVKDRMPGDKRTFGGNMRYLGEDWNKDGPNCITHTKSIIIKGLDKIINGTRYKAADKATAQCIKERIQAMKFYWPSEYKEPLKKLAKEF